MSTADDIRVMLVDDSNTIRFMLGALLDETSGLRMCATAEDGEAAVTEALANRPDVIVMDMQMPGIDGLDAAREILQRWPEARIIMNTAYDDDSLKQAAEAAGAAAYFTKDQRPIELVEIIRTVHNEVSVNSSDR